MNLKLDFIIRTVVGEVVKFVLQQMETALVNSDKLKVVITKVMNILNSLGIKPAGESTSQFAVDIQDLIESVLHVVKLLKKYFH